jgi:hypothetical protein
VEWRIGHSDRNEERFDVQTRDEIRLTTLARCAG